MKSVMIIGRLDKTTEELYGHLSAVCPVHICENNDTVIHGTLGLVKPDVVVVPLSDEDSSPEDVFFLLERERHRPPIVAIGSVQVQGKLIRDRWLPNRRIVFLQRPIQMEDVVTCVKSSLADGDGPREDHRKKVLVVDDDPNMLRVMNRMLSTRWNVSFATSAARALVTISKARPDLVLLDYDMPLIDGMTLFKVLRAERETEDIPVVFLTGISDPACVEQILALHPQGYLLKPPSEEKIIHKLAEVLGEKL